MSPVLTHTHTHIQQALGGVLRLVPRGIGSLWGQPARFGAPGVVLGPHTVVCGARGALAGACWFVVVPCLSLLCFVCARSVRLLVLCSVFRVLVVC